MFYSGISDEAGQAIEQQIQAHLELGWKHLELRLVDGVNITAIPQAEFDSVCEKVAAAGMQVSCFGSAIANWARPITCDANIDIDDLKQAIPRMKRLGAQYIRVMSYPNDPKNPIPEKEWRAEAIRRMKTLAKIAEDGGIILAHENCSGWGGLSAENSNILLGEVNSSALKVLYDTANPVSYGQDPWEYYQTVFNDIVYVHIKDVKKVNGEDVYTFCGDGEGRVRDTIRDILSRGYDGCFSIEPHLAAIIHTGQKAENDAQLHDTYTSYGRRLMEIMKDIREELGLAPV